MQAPRNKPHRRAKVSTRQGPWIPLITPSDHQVGAGKPIAANGEEQTGNSQEPRGLTGHGRWFHWPEASPNSRVRDYNICFSTGSTPVVKNLSLK